MLSALGISATGLEARRVWMNTIAENIANAETTRDANGFPNPYRRREPLFQADPQGGAIGVRVQDVVPDLSEFNSRYEPGHADADEDGMVLYPNINVVQEMVDMLMASRSYEANVTAMETTKSMFSSAMRIIG
ncbi:MAG: flagellar basal body rod protein FlgC [Planctomycetes bacterium]|nr:flagellar basal body rod protein FlgC [Planctomycetota bacterium]